MLNSNYVDVGETYTTFARGWALQVHPGKAYARNRIPQVWIHNLISGKLEVYQDSDGEEYRSKQVLSADQHVDVPGFDINISWC